jgi:1-acyl-sn-glycerol-3-phosphate acyltransferase
MPCVLIFIKIHQEPFYWKYIGRMFGFDVRFRNKEIFGSAQEAPIIVSNHITDFDGIAMFPILMVEHTVALTSKFLQPLVRVSQL